MGFEGKTVDQKENVEQELVGRDPQNLLCTMETWREDRLHVHTRGRTQGHRSHKEKKRHEGLREDEAENT